jgi:hypothetical protein
MPSFYDNIERKTLFNVIREIEKRVHRREIKGKRVSARNERRQNEMGK